MLVLFFVPVVCIGFFEAVIDPNRNSLLREWVHTSIAADDAPNARNPKVTGEDAERGLAISKIPFAELIKEFPKTTMVGFLHFLPTMITTEIYRFKSAEATIVGELGNRMDALNRRIDGMEEKMDLIIRLLYGEEK